MLYVPIKTRNSSAVAVGDLPKKLIAIIPKIHKRFVREAAMQLALFNDSVKTSRIAIQSGFITHTAYGSRRVRYNRLDHEYGVEVQSCSIFQWRCPNGTRFTLSICGRDVRAPGSVHAAVRCFILGAFHSVVPHSVVSLCRMKCTTEWGQPNEQNRREHGFGTHAIGVNRACQCLKVAGSEKGSGTNSAKHLSGHLAIGS